MDILEKIKSIEKKKLFMIIGATLAVLIIIIILILPKEQQMGVSIGKIVLAKGETESKQPVNPTDMFSDQDQEIHAIITVDSLPAGIVVEYQWYDLKNEKIIKSEQKQSAEDFFGNSSSFIKKSENVWEKGEYAFRILIGGRVVAEEQYMVMTPGEIESTRALYSIKEINLVTSVDLRGNPASDPSTIFSVDDKKIYASISYQDSPYGTQFEGKFFFLKNDQFIKSYKKTISGTGSFAFSMDAEGESWLPTKKWDKGKYKLYIYLNGDLAEEVSFSIS